MNTLPDLEHFKPHDPKCVTILWSFGKDQYDVQPTEHQGSWDEFIAFICSHKALKKGLNYIASSFGGDRRCKANAMPRQWIPFDIDCKMTDDQAYDLVGVFRSFKCIGYQTASSLPNARRMRFIVQTTRSYGELEAGAIGHLIESIWRVDEFDKSVYRSAQPIFLPPTTQKVFTFDGDAIDVDEVMKMVDVEPPKKYPKKYTSSNNVDVYQFFLVNGLIKQSVGDFHKVRCPWVHEHTDGEDGGTALYDPSPNNNMAGGFVCLHSHCLGRGIGDVLRLIGGDK